MVRKNVEKFFKKAGIKRLTFKQLLQTENERTVVLQRISEAIHASHTKGFSAKEIQIELNKEFAPFYAEQTNTYLK